MTDDVIIRLSQDQALVLSNWLAEMMGSGSTMRVACLTPESVFCHNLAT